MNERTCIVTRRTGPIEDMIRFVAAPDDSVAPDLKARLPGRGAWVSADADTVRKAVAKGAFARAMRRPVKPAADLDQLVAGLLKDQALGALGMAMRAGQVITGYAKVEAAVRGAKAQILIHASDGAKEGWRKLDKALRAMEHGRGEQVAPPFLMRWFSAADLGLALGRENVVHAAVKQGRLAVSFLQAATRWHRYVDAAGKLV